MVDETPTADALTAHRFREDPGDELVEETLLEYVESTRITGLRTAVSLTESGPPAGADPRRYCQERRR